VVNVAVDVTAARGAAEPQWKHSSTGCSSARLYASRGGCNCRAHSPSICCHRHRQRGEPKSAEGRPVDGMTWSNAQPAHTVLHGGLHLDGVTLTSVRFERAALSGVTFRGATLRDVSFRAWSRMYRTALRTVAFDEARMDKLTYAGLKGMGADLSNVTVG
jgi:uncharacterized protein YjbI with pentapeptide repeats